MARSKTSTERLFIGRVLADADIRPAIEAKITPEFFVEDDVAEVWDWFLHYYREYNSTAPLATFKREFPNFRIVKPSDPMQYFLDTLRDRRKAELLQQTLVEAAAAFDERDLQATIDSLSAGLVSVSTETSGLRDTNLVDTWAERIERYEEWKKYREKGGLRGIPSGFASLDRSTLGFQPEQLITFIGQPKAGKAHPLHTPVLTPTGWKMIGDIDTGDLVIGRSGAPCRVTATHDWEDHEVWTLRTSDGRYVEIAPEHEWHARVRRGSRRWEDMETREIKDALDAGYTVHLPVIDTPPEFDHEDLPLDPYALGLLLGDGGFSQPTSVTFTNSDGLEEFLPFPRTRMGDRDQWRLRNALPVVRMLGLAKRYSHEKFVPYHYLWTSAENRRALLAGLLDTNGGNEGKSVTYSTSSPQLRDDLVYLVRSLGGMATWTEREPWFTYKGERRQGRMNYIVRVRTPFNPFRCGHKHDEWARQHPEGPRDIVLSVEAIETSDQRETVRCLTVDAPDGLYVTQDWLVTHNSTLMMVAAIRAHETGRIPLFVGFEMSNEEQEVRYDSITSGVSHHALLSGGLRPSEQKKMAREMKRRRGMQPFILSSDIHSGTTVTGLAAKIDEYRPDILFVDGVYMMDDEHGETKGTPQALTNLTRGLKRLAQTKRIPIVCSTQVLTWKLGRGRRLSQDSIGYSSSFAQDSDLIIGVEHTEEEDLKRLRLVEGRMAKRGEFLVRWDWETGTFEEEVEQYGPEAEDENGEPVAIETEF